MKRILFTLALVAVPALAHAGAHKVMGNKKKQSITCKAGDTVDVTGNSNTLTIRGECAALSVAGNGNEVTIDAAASISTAGNKNHVTWKKQAGGKDPDVTNPGTGNVIEQAK